MVQKTDDLLVRREPDKNIMGVINLFSITKENYKEKIKNLNNIKEIKEILQSFGLEEYFSKSIDTNNHDNKIKNLEKNKKLIDSVISKFMDSYSNIEVQIEPIIDLLISKNNRKISVMKLSQGEKTLLSLVLDIARRLIILNPSLENPLEGQGIVLIDEFDLHLHPQWQKEAARNLVETFPNCQFFLTTHSPIVLTEVDRKHIYILENDENESISIKRPEQSFGLTILETTNELMTPPDKKQLGRNQQIEDILERIFHLINEETTLSLKSAQKEISLLEKKIHGDIPELLRAKTQIDLILEWQEDEKNQ